MKEEERKAIRNVENAEVNGSISGIPKLMYDHWQVDAIQIATAEPLEKRIEELEEAVKAERDRVVREIENDVPIDQILIRLNMVYEMQNSTVACSKLEYIIHAIEDFQSKLNSLKGETKQAMKGRA